LFSLSAKPAIGSVFALPVGHLHPVIGPADRIAAVAHLGDAPQAGLAGVLVHLAAELDLDPIAVELYLMQPTLA
jgi:hypothetical protein